MANTYNRLGLLAMTGLNLASDDIRVLLVGSGYTFNKDHDYVSDVVANESSGSGYVRKVLASKTTTLNDTSDRVEFDAADVTWTALTTGAAIAAAIVYKHVTNDGDSPLLAYLDLTPAVAGNGGDYTVQFDAIGLFRIQPSP